MKMRYFFMLKVFSNFEWFKSNLENGPSPSSYFRANFLTVRPNAANDMALESWNKCETLLYILFLPIPYGFKSVLKMGKNIFSS